MFVGTVEFDVLLGDVHSLKEKRAVVRPIVGELRRRFDVAAAEVGALDLHRRASVGVAVVAAEAAHCRDVLDACERLVAARPEVELLSVRRRLHSSDDD
jgi:uncharacterized protein YlxP (DUF503 family)